MFDRTTIQSGPSYQYSTITEKRAPTDESVRLLREMESQAKAQVLKSMVLPSNEFKGVAHTMRECLTGDDVVAVMFKLNGTEHRVDVRLNDFADGTLEKRAQKIIAAVANKLACTILSDIVTNDFMQSIKP